MIHHSLENSNSIQIYKNLILINHFFQTYSLRTQYKLYENQQYFSLLYFIKFYLVLELLIKNMYIVSYCVHNSNYFKLK